MYSDARRRRAAAGCSAAAGCCGGAGAALRRRGQRRKKKTARGRSLAAVLLETEAQHAVCAARFADVQAEREVGASGGRAGRPAPRAATQTRHRRAPRRQLLPLTQAD